MWRLVIAGLAACSFERGQPATPTGDANEPDDGRAPDDTAKVDAFVLPGVVARWEFDETSGIVARDTSGVGTPLDLMLDPGVTTALWGGGALRITTDTRLRTNGPATKIFDACSASDAVTVEAWIRPADNLQTGPARVLTISSDISNRNIMLAQIGATFALRIRTNNTDDNGTPDIGTGAVIAGAPGLMHVVITADTSERLIYVDGMERGKDALGGDLSGWNDTYPVLVANEEAPATARAWHGSIHRIVIYKRRLPETEIKTLHANGL